MQQASGSAVSVQRNSSSASLTRVLWDLKRSQHSVKDLAPSTDLILGGGRGTRSLVSGGAVSCGPGHDVRGSCAVDLSTLPALAVLQLQSVRKAANDHGKR